MEVVEAAIPEVKVITPKKFGDHLRLAVPGYPRLLQNDTDRFSLPQAVPCFLSLGGQHAIGPQQKHPQGVLQALCSELRNPFRLLRTD